MAKAGWPKILQRAPAPEAEPKRSAARWLGSAEPTRPEPKWILQRPPEANAEQKVKASAAAAAAEHVRALDEAQREAEESSDDVAGSLRAPSVALFRGRAALLAQPSLAGREVGARRVAQGARAATDVARARRTGTRTPSEGGGKKLLRPSRSQRLPP